MTTKTEIPYPKSIDELNYETILNEIKTSFLTLFTDEAKKSELEKTLQIESEPLLKLMQNSAYRELKLRQRINDGIKATMIALAQGSDLDNLAIPKRLIIKKADNTTTPPTAAVMEDDEAYRRRALLYPENFSTAGSSPSYIYHTLTADTNVKDVMPLEVSNGVVELKILAKDGEANQDLLTKIKNYFDEKIRVLGTELRVSSATKVDYEIEAKLHSENMPDASLALNQAQNDISKYVESRRKISADIHISAIYAALHQPSVNKVEIIKPAADVAIDNTKFANCTNINITLA